MFTTVEVVSIVIGTAIAFMVLVPIVLLTLIGLRDIVNGAERAMGGWLSGSPVTRREATSFLTLIFLIAVFVWG